MWGFDFSFRSGSRGFAIILGFRRSRRGRLKFGGTGFRRHALFFFALLTFSFGFSRFALFFETTAIEIVAALTRFGFGALLFAAHIFKLA
jgi:hypothetical protein